MNTDTIEHCERCGADWLTINTGHGAFGVRCANCGMTDDDDTNDNATAVAESLNAECRRLRLGLLDDDQRAALTDESQVFAMLDDLEARCGLNVADARARVVDIFVDDDGSDLSPNDCPECARAFGPHYTGRCDH